MKQELFDNQATVSHSLTQLSYTAREQRIPMQNRCSESKFVRKPCSLLLAFVGINLRRIARRGVIPSAREESLCYPEPATGGVRDLMLLSIWAGDSSLRSCFAQNNIAS